MCKNNKYRHGEDINIFHGREKAVGGENQLSCSIWRNIMKREIPANVTTLALSPAQQQLVQARRRAPTAALPALLRRMRGMPTAKATRREELLLSHEIYRRFYGVP